MERQPCLEKGSSVRTGTWQDWQMCGPGVERDTARSRSDPPSGVRVVMNVESLNREVEDS